MGTFQAKLKKLVFTKLIVLVSTGALLMVSCMALAITATNHAGATKNSQLFADTFNQIYGLGTDFLTDSEVQDACRKILLYQGGTSMLSYSAYELNAACPLDSRLVLCDKERNSVYNSFRPYEWNLYRSSFNKAICDNAFGSAPDGIYTSVYYFEGTNSDYVMSRPISADGATIGYLNLYLKGDGWAQCLSDSGYEGVITDNAGRVIYSSRFSFVQEVNKFQLESPGPIVQIHGTRYWLDRQTAGDGNAVIYSLVYYPHNMALLLIGGGVIAVMSLLWYKLADNMRSAMAASNAAAIQKLVSEIRIIRKTDPDHRVEMGTEDEFSIVGVQINHMLDHIQELNSRNTELLRLKNQTEIGQLTAQINPHFLYNTLEIIRNLVVFDPARADSLIIQLTQILRYSIDTSREYVHLDEDMAYIGDYLDIQKCRYGDRLRYEINIGEDCLPCMIPKLVLQPIIENSIKYGFQKKQQIHILITGCLDNSLLLLSVKDDGLGMPEAEALGLAETLHSPRPGSEHIGLRNIARRLFLQYGSESGLELKNEEGVGLEVIVKIRQKGEN